MFSIRSIFAYGESCKHNHSFVKSQLKLAAASVSMVALTAFLAAPEAKANGGYGASETVELPAASECLYVDAYGADASGASDSSAAFQAAVNDSAALQKKVCVPGGVYRFQKPVKMKSNSSLYMARDAVMARSFEAGSSHAGALLQSESYTSKTNNVTIVGGTLTSTWNGVQYGGRMIDWFGDNWTVENIYVLGWGTLEINSRAINYVGDNGVVRNSTFREPGCGEGCAGIMVNGGDGHLIENNDVMSGDDAICVFPSAAPTDPLFNYPISNAHITHNKGSSTNARAFAMGLHIRPDAEPGEPPLDTTIQGVYVRDFVGSVTGGKRTSMALLVENMTDAGAVRDVVLDDVHIVNNTLLAQGFKINGNPYGTVDNVTITGSSYAGKCDRSALHISQVNSASIQNGAFTASTVCDYAFYSLSSSGVTTLDTLFDGRTYVR